MTDLQWLIDLARFAHILCIAIGFGAAFVADIQIAQHLARPVDDQTLHLIDLCHRVLSKVVIGMWITGLILIQIRTQFVPANFTPKLISKLVVVAILTVNAGLIGRVAMPVIRRARGSNLFGLPLRTKAMLAFIGGVSSVSWLLAMAMGSSKILAASGWGVFVILLPVAYGVAIVLVLGLLGVLPKGVAVMKQLGQAKHPRDHRSAPIPVPAPIPANRLVGRSIAAE